MSRHLLFYVQHLVGVGHVFRAIRIVKALVAAGHKVDVIYGGEPIPDFDEFGATMHFLPPLRAGKERFNDLEDPDGNIVDDAYREARRDRILKVFAQGNHDAILTEAFPFGRRQMRFELIPLLEAAAKRPEPPVVIASVRDILQENRKPGRDRETVETLRQYFDLVLVHGDPALVTLGATFPPADEIADMVRYTGIVAPDPKAATGDAEKFDVVVSVGGGMMGRGLLVAAAGAKRLSCLKEARWCIITGLRSEDGFDIAGHVDKDVAVRRFLPHLDTVLKNAELSISRCGYNTTADLLRAGCRAIVSPLYDGTETEQLRRAEMLDRRGLATMLKPEDQTPEKVAAAIDRTMAGPPPPPHGLNLDGAETTARMVGEILAARR